MIIEITTPFDNSVDAQQRLKTLKDHPGFIIGYVTVTEKEPQEFHLVTLFKCNHVTQELPQQQRNVFEVRWNPAGVLGTPVTPYSSIPMALE